MSGAAAIAWIGAWVAEPDGRGHWGTGAWGQPGALHVPLDDRGLLLADGLFETVLVEQGETRLLAEHHRRWRQGAALLALPPPPDQGAVQRLAAEAIQRSGISSGALRLNWSRGSGGRGLDPAAGSPWGAAIPSPPRVLDPTAAPSSAPESSHPKTTGSLPQPHRPASPGCQSTELAEAPSSPTAGLQAGGRFWLQLSACSPVFRPLAVIISPSERRCATSLLSRTKGFGYGSAIQARHQARAAGVDDALLESTAGGLCCGTAANLLLQLEGRWLTPPLSSGCLPGVMRQRALERAGVEEAPLPLALLRGGASTAAALLINSLGCRPIHRCEGLDLQPLTATEAEAFWRRLL